MKKWILAFILVPLVSLASDEVAKDSASPAASLAASSSTVSEETAKAVRNSGAEDKSLTATIEKAQAVPLEAKNESEIPVKLDAEKKEAAQGKSVFQILGGLLLCVGLIFGTVIFVRKYSLKNQKNPMHQIKVVTQYHLGPRKSLAVIRVAGESVLVGVTEHHISHIKTLALLDGDLPETDEVPQSFNSTLKKQDPEAEEDFSIQGIQDVVKNKLKSMRNI